MSPRLRFAALSVSCLALGACGSVEVEQPAPPPVDPRVYQPPATFAQAPQKSAIERDRENLDAFGKAFAQNDAKLMSTLLDPEVDFSFPGMSDATDREGTLRGLEALLGPFTSRKYAASRIWQIGEAAIVEWNMTAVHSGTWMGVPATQKEVSIRGLTLVWFNLNGLVNELHLYFDCGVLLAQIGAPAVKGLEVPPAAPLAATPVVMVAGGTPEERTNVAIVNASWDALESRNEPGYLAPMADDIEVTALDRAAPQRGKEERRKYFRWLTTGISSLAQTPRNAWGAGNFVIEEYSITGVHSGRLTSFPPSGHALRLFFVDIYEMQGGKISKISMYGNSLELYAETGAVAAAAPGSILPAAVQPASSAPLPPKPAPRTGATKP